MQLFYNPSLDHSFTQFTFEAEESKHIVKVLRKKVGDHVHITNGEGELFTAEILIADSKKCKASIIDSEKRHEKMHSLHMVVAPTKNIERFEWFLEKATEIGVNEITPIICDHSERKTLKKERLERIVQAAMKQSLRTYLPTLHDPVSFQDFMEKEQAGILFIAHCQDDEKMELKRRVAADKDLVIMIGPEGDFSRTEIDQAYEKGFYPVSLGEARLRTETAALVACSIVAMVNSR